MGCVYVWTNTVNGKQYVGMTVQPDVRKKSHLSSVRSGKGCYSFHNAVRKYGIEAFTYEEVFWSEDRKELAAREIKEIARRGTFTDRSKGYNLTPGGEGVSDLTPEAKAKKVAGIRAAFARPEVKARQREAQARPEVKAKVSAGSKAAWANLEHRAMRLASINAAYERPGVRAKQLAAMKEALSRPEVRAKQLAAMKIASERPEYRALKAQQSTEMWREDGFREKRAEAMMKAWEETPWADKLSESGKLAWEDPDRAEWRRQQCAASVQTQANRQQHSEDSLQRWNDPEYRERWYTRHNIDKVSDDRGNVYDCVTDAATKLGVDRDVIYRAIKSGKFKRISRSTGNKGFGRTPRPCIADGVVYPSFRAASVAHGINDGTVALRVNSNSKRARWWQALPYHGDPECDAVEECWAQMQFAAACPDHPNVPVWAKRASAAA